MYNISTSLKNLETKMTLNSRQEAFCRAYAGGAKGALAARQAGYGAAGAASQASRMLHNPEVAERIGEFHSEHAALRAEAARELLDKLEPVYQTGLDAGDTGTVLQVVELQARIAGLIVGGSILPRSGRSGAAHLGAANTAYGSDRGHMEFLALLDEEADAAAAENVPEC
jgi:hypothetical protein